MADFSTILQDPAFRPLVQDGILERSFHDSLYPRLLYRGEAVPQIFPGHVGDSMTFTGAGLIAPKLQPLQPGSDPTPSTFSSEQWSATLNEYADSVDTHLPTSAVAIANLFLRNSQQLGLAAAQSLNRIARNRLYNGALSGNTVAQSTGAPFTSTTLPVQRLDGFTRARRPDLSTGSPVQFQQVSANNPLAIHVFDNGADAVFNVIGYSSVTPGDEIGPGTLTLSSSLTSVAARAYVISSDATYLVRVGGAKSIDGITSANLFTLAAVRAAVARFRSSNVPAQPDLRYHCHLDPTSEAQIFADNEFQRLLTALPDYFMYRDFSVGELLGVAFYRNSEAPVPETVYNGSTGVFSQLDPFPGELYTLNSPSTGVRVHRPLFLGQGYMYEYYEDLAGSGFITEAGVTGKMAEPKITNNGIEVFSDRIQLIIRAPLDRLQQLVSTSYRFIGDWPIRTDVTTGDGARYKRAVSVEHGE